jgi:predicted nucleic acid-binding protein
MMLAHENKRPSTYDCHYLALAERYECELWTGDERLYNAVGAKLPWVKWIGETTTPA